MDRDDFYVGYSGRASGGIAKRTRTAVGVAVAVGVSVALAGAAFQGPFAAKTFEYGVEREFVGWLRLQPLPRLVVAAPGNSAEAPTLLSFPLTRAGSKLGAGPLVAPHDGRFVRLRGWLIYREGNTVIDVLPGSLSHVDDAEAGPNGGQSVIAELGLHTLAGEIVDSKCFTGVMNPATGKVHRACAARCISSGTPPLLVARSDTGADRHLLLVGPNGSAINREVLEYVAEPVQIRGRVRRVDQLLVLYADPAEILRLGLP